MKGIVGAINITFYCEFLSSIILNGKSRNKSILIVLNIISIVMTYGDVDCTQCTFFGTLWLDKGLIYDKLRWEKIRKFITFIFRSYPFYWSQNKRIYAIQQRKI